MCLTWGGSGGLEEEGGGREGTGRWGGAVCSHYKACHFHMFILY